MGRGVGYGKVILFGEHFVVHGAPALAVGLDKTSIVEVMEARENDIVTEHTVVPEISRKGIQGVLDSMGIKKKYQVYLGGDLPTYGGLGSSAAFCVGLVRALSEETGRGLNDEDVNKHAYDGEMAFHGNPSGIDNLVATYRGAILFRRGSGGKENEFEFLNTGVPLHLVVSFTGKFSNTVKMVDAVKSFKEQDEDEFAQLMDEYTDLAAEGRKALEKGKLDVLGNLMNQNQSLLSELGVSTEENDRICELALNAGALGAKLTGGGGGGCCIALARDEAAALGIRMALEKEGFKSFYSRVEKRA
ncbi:MAG: mevalonate kinase [Candidatus Micrarchaeota archaeon]